MYVHGESHVGFVTVVVGWRTALFHHQMQLVQERRGPVAKIKLATFLHQMPRKRQDMLGRVWEFGETINSNHNSSPCQHPLLIPRLET